LKIARNQTKADPASRKYEERKKGEEDMNYLMDRIGNKVRVATPAPAPEVPKS
jgi:hypothetical protein